MHTFFRTDTRWYQWRNGSSIESCIFWPEAHRYELWRLKDCGTASTQPPDHVTYAKMALVPLVIYLPVSVAVRLWCFSSFVSVLSLVLHVRGSLCILASGLQTLSQYPSKSWLAGVPLHPERKMGYNSLSADVSCRVGLWQSVHVCLPIGKVLCL